jgi:phage terminase large subunit GpA-like protein
MDDFSVALADVASAYPALVPPNRMRVSEGAAQILKIQRPGGGSGPWSPAETPYMVKPMDTLASRRHRAVCFVGPAQTGKALDVDTPIPGPDGWKRMGDLVVGDRVLGDEGDPCNVTEAHPVRLNRPCFQVELDDGSTVVADEEHLWRVWVHGHVTVEDTVTVRAMVAHARTLGRLWERSLPTVVNHGPGASRRRRIVSVEPVPTRPVRCIRVDGPRSMFLAGVGMVPTHNTVALVDAWMAHNVVNDPGDMAIFQMTQDKAREYSKQRIDRAIRNSPALYAMRSAQARDDNLHDKQFRNGMWVRLAWPTATNMASTSYRYVAGTDYDRWPDDIDGEGDGFTLMGKRTTTFLSRGMVVVESSPGRHIRDPSWRPSGPHEAPPVGGVLGIYNTSDRQRLYWKCPHCAGWFQAEPGLGLFRLPSDSELLEGIRDLNIDAFSHQFARVPCPHCGAIITPAHRERMNARATWLEEGLAIDDHDRISGDPRKSSVAGFWLGGVAATYVSWRQLIEKHLQALLDYSLSGSELKLMSTANTDQGVPYLERALAEAAEAGKREPPRSEGLQRYVVPDWTRFVASSVDVQGGQNARFVVQTHAIGEYQEQALINRREIKWSRRPGQGDQFAPIDPARYPEDWDILTDEVVQATYRTSIEGQELRTHMTFVDSGGEAGVTTMAYAWARRLRTLGLHRKARITKGHNQKAEWHIRETMVGGEQGKGDVPLLLLEPNKFKDLVDANLKRQEPGPGFYHFPPPQHPVKNPSGWLTQAFFDELKAEVRGESGVWEKVRARNEAFDLCYMIRAACMHVGADKRTFWASPPSWALPLTEGNSGLVASEVRRTEREVAAQAAPTPAAVKASVRPVRRSAYMGWSGAV